MSANRWSFCPNCKKKEQDRIEAEEKKVLAQYGKIDPELFIKNMADVKIRPMMRETLREDYDFTLDEYLDLSMSYSAHCDKCGYKFEYKNCIAAVLLSKGETP